MPGNLIKENTLGETPRYIESNLKSRRIVWEKEHPVRWSFMKVLREYSTLKQFYPNINPYTEVYKVRKNTYALYNDSFDGAGDVWMYLIDGPNKCLLVDTSFGIGDLKALIRHIVGDKEIIVCNTHAHYDHCYGNAQFDKVFCHKYEVLDLKQKNNPNIWGYLFNNTNENMHVWNETIGPGEPIYTKFDKKDIIINLDNKNSYKEYEICGVDDDYVFDLGNNYFVKVIHIPGHTPGHMALFDLQTNCLFSGDLTGIGNRQDSPYSEYCTVEAMYLALEKLSPNFSKIEGVFPGHGTFDLSPLILEYLKDTLLKILANPSNYDSIREIKRHGTTMVSMTKNIYQWTAVRYTNTNIYKNRDMEISY